LPIAAPGKIFDLTQLLKLYPSKELIGANLELLGFPLQHDRGFAGSEGRAALNRVRSSPKYHPLAEGKLFQLFVVSLGIDPLHGLVS
jgi:hypothetical protein